MGTQLATGEHRQGLLDAATEFAAPIELQVARLGHGATTLLDKNLGHYRMTGPDCQPGPPSHFAEGRESSNRNLADFCLLDIPRFL
jgi:hypothetical protein